MPNFVCPKCSKQFARNDYLIKHMSKKIPCDMDLTTCEDCGKRFSNKRSCYRHKRTCNGANILNQSNITSIGRDYINQQNNG